MVGWSGTRVPGGHRNGPFRGVSWAPAARCGTADEGRQGRGHTKQASLWSSRPYRARTGTAMSSLLPHRLPPRRSRGSCLRHVSKICCNNYFDLRGHKGLNVPARKYVCTRVSSGLQRIYYCADLASVSSSLKRYRYSLPKGLTGRSMPPTRRRQAPSRGHACLDQFLTP